MSVVKIKSFDVGNGDMFYINHMTDNFTVIDCNLIEGREEEIMREIITESKSKGIRRFISTHPDEDHIHGLEWFNHCQTIHNFYCVDNQVNKEDTTDSFEFYKQIRDDSKKVFHICRNCNRKWMNCNSEERRSSGINILWPDTKSYEFQEALEYANETGEPNNISPIIKYELNGGARVLWFGDLEHDFMESIQDKINIPSADIIFAPHHGRDSGTIPKKWLEQINPQVIILGTAPSEYINYYSDYETITQNTAKDITLYCENNKVYFCSSNKNYGSDIGLDNEYYIGDITTRSN